jgi:hypothetical protein
VAFLSRAFLFCESEEVRGMDAMNERRPVTVLCNVSFDPETGEVVAAACDLAKLLAAFQGVETANVAGLAVEAVEVAPAAQNGAE